MDQPIETLCSTCHQPVLPRYYFCPNCGNKLKLPPLSTSFATQMKIYAHSLILPALGFITVSKWRGVQYLKSQNEKAKQIGMTACVILALSTIVVGWYVVELTKSLTQSAVSGINGDIGGY